MDIFVEIVKYQGHRFILGSGLVYSGLYSGHLSNKPQAYVHE